MIDHPAAAKVAAISSITFATGTWLEGLDFWTRVIASVIAGLAGLYSIYSTYRKNHDGK